MLPKHYITQRHSYRFIDLRLWWKGLFSSTSIMSYTLNLLLKEGLIYRYKTFFVMAPFGVRAWPKHTSQQHHPLTVPTLILDRVWCWYWWGTGTANWTCRSIVISKFPPMLGEWAEWLSLLEYLDKKTGRSWSLHLNVMNVLYAWIRTRMCGQERVMTWSCHVMTIITTNQNNCLKSAL